MRFDPVDPPRRFRAGRLAEVEMSDTGRLALDPDEQVTLTTPSGGEYDVALGQGETPWTVVILDQADRPISPEVAVAFDPSQSCRYILDWQRVN